MKRCQVAFSLVLHISSRYINFVSFKYDVEMVKLDFIFLKIIYIIFLNIIFMSIVTSDTVFYFFLYKMFFTNLGRCNVIVILQDFIKSLQLNIQFICLLVFFVLLAKSVQKRAIQIIYLNNIYLNISYLNNNKTQKIKNGTKKNPTKFIEIRMKVILVLCKIAEH